ncbi:MAG: hypothetical protein KA207_02870 [Burkholderiaceae bacterium]|nr:hypothetical protein [Burkholderiaceae bacterium]
MIELNIRLDVSGQDNSDSAITQRKIQALAILGKCFHHRADYLVDGVTVPRLVVGMDNFDTDRLHRLAQELGQDCIAVYFPDQGHGELLGPSAAAWGGFSLARFQRLDERKAADEEMARAFGFA